MARGNHSSAPRGSHAAGYQQPVSAATYSRSSYGSQAPGGKGSKKKGNRFWRVVFVVSLVVLIGAVGSLAAIVYQYWAQQNAYNDLEQYASLSDSETLSLADLTVDWAALQAINPDIVAWVYVPGTEINYPVVQGEDNEEYLHTAFDGSTGWLASAGTIFLDASNASDLSDRNSALYGHHMNDGSMFAAIADWTTEEEFNSHRDVYVLTPEGNYRLKTYALVLTTGTDAIVQTTFASDESFAAYVQDKLDRSVVSQTGDVLSATDIQKSMILSTCEYSQNDGRAVLFAAVVETTVADDPYISASEEGTTGLSSNDLGDITDRSSEEAA